MSRGRARRRAKRCGPAAPRGSCERLHGCRPTPPRLTLAPELGALAQQRLGARGRGQDLPDFPHGLGYGSTYFQERGAHRTIWRDLGLVCTCHRDLDSLRPDRPDGWGKVQTASTPRLQNARGPVLSGEADGQPGGPGAKPAPEDSILVGALEAKARDLTQWGEVDPEPCRAFPQVAHLAIVPERGRAVLTDQEDQKVM